MNDDIHGKATDTASENALGVHTQGETVTCDRIFPSNQICEFMKPYLVQASKQMLYNSQVNIMIEACLIERLVYRCMELVYVRDKTEKILFCWKRCATNSIYALNGFS